MKPSVGRIVHYIGYMSQKCQAAMVTDVDSEDGSVSLTVFGPDNTYSTSDIFYDADSIDCTWHWLEREES